MNMFYMQIDTYFKIAMRYVEQDKSNSLIPLCYYIYILHINTKSVTYAVLLFIVVFLAALHCVMYV